MASAVNENIKNGDPRSDLISGIISVGDKCERNMSSGSIHTRILDFLPWIDGIQSREVR